MDFWWADGREAARAEASGTAQYGPAQHSSLTENTNELRWETRGSRLTAHGLGEDATQSSELLRPLSTSTSGPHTR